MSTSLADLIRLAGETNEKNGYNGYAKANADGYGIDYLAKKDLLEVSELTEALDELRHGYTPGDVYTSGEDQKPEGYLVEKADAVIRAFGTFYEVIQEHGLTPEFIESIIVGKIEYNARRADTKASGVKGF